MLGICSDLTGGGARSGNPFNVLDFFQVETSHSGDEGSCGLVRARTSCSHGFSCLRRSRAFRLFSLRYQLHIAHPRVDVM
jgi:hypothetical protein